MRQQESPKEFLHSMLNKSNIQIYMLVRTSCGGKTSAMPPATVHPHRGGSSKARFMVLSIYAVFVASPSDWRVPSLVIA